MSSTYRLAELLIYVAPRVPTPTHLRILAAKADFHAYRLTGDSITGTVWCKGHEFAYPQGMTEREWLRVTRGIWRCAQPLWANQLGKLFAAWVLWRLVRSRTDSSQSGLSLPR